MIEQDRGFTEGARVTILFVLNFDSPVIESSLVGLERLKGYEELSFSNDTQRAAALTAKRRS